MTNDPWLILLIPYFGRWPAWINLFVESCKWNPDVRWLLFTDCGEPDNTAENVGYVHLSFAGYKALVRERLGIAFDPADPYKLCDLRPCFAHIHGDRIEGYPFFGYGDIDVVYGSVRRFYTDELLARYDVLSTHPERLTGHFAVLRNSADMRRAYERIPDYRALLEKPSHVSTDEAHFSALLLAETAANGRGLFVERYSTILSPRGWHDGTMNYPQRWFWRRGSLTNERDGAREFLYLHFMRWQSRRWINDPPAPGEAAWVGRDRIVQVDWRRAGEDGFCISPEGFTTTERGREGTG